MTQSQSSMQQSLQQQQQFLQTQSQPTQSQPAQSNGSTSQQSGGGGNAAVAAQVPWGGPFPSLHLWPIQDTFQMKMIQLPDQQRVKIGRQTNAKTMPAERNAYFDSKVLSRTHAEIWEHAGKMFIKDVKSSNGTFINGERLSQEGIESEPFELKSEDMVEFGIDIVSEDNRTIVHHKVAAKIYCVFGPEDAALSARELVHYANDRSGRRPGSGQPSSGNQHQLAQAGPVVMSSGGKVGGLSFDHVLGKLQAELQRSKETGAELQGLTSAMTEIQDTLGGGLPPSQNGSAVQFIPPQFRSASAEAQAALAGPHGQQAAAFISLQNQLTETQTSLSGHLDKIRQLEGQLKDHESIKHEISIMREQMEESKREMEALIAGSRGRQAFRLAEEDEDDDAKSVMTLMDDEDAQERVRDRRKSQSDGDRPVTPEPTLNDDGEEGEKPNGHGEPESVDLGRKIEILSVEIEEANKLSKTLQEQHGEAMSAVRLLTERVEALEGGMASKVAAEVSKAEQRWDVWRVKFEEGWRKERESWEVERERLRGVVREWEEASRRAHEEEEDRELNESLGEDEFLDEEDEDDDPPSVVGDNLLNLENLDVPGLPMSPSRKARKRRPSQKAALAVRALRGVIDDANGASTPKAEALLLDDPSTAVPLRTRELRKAGRGGAPELRKGFEKSSLARTGSASTFKGVEKDSSESGKESGDTLKDVDEKRISKRAKKRNPRTKAPLQPLPIFTVVVVAVAIGALYYRQKE